MMSKARKWIINIALALTAVFCACGAVACGEPKRLDTPENLQLEGRMLTWDEVDGADGYAVCVDDQEYLVEDNAFEIPFLVGPKTYRVEVMALGDWKKTKDSAWGEIEYTKGLPAEEGEKDGFHFVLMDDLESYEIVACDNKEGYVEFPDDYLDYPVKKIGDDLFAPPREVSINATTGENCNQITTGVKLPRYLEEIGDNAFSYCIVLEEVIIPDTVMTIGDSAFQFCIRLKEIEFPSSLHTIGKGAFSCALYGQEELIFPDGIENIGLAAFSNGRHNGGFNYVSRFRKVVIPNSIKSIEDSAFSNNLGLEEVEICTENIEEFGAYVFSDTAWYEAQPEGLVYVDKVLYGYKGDMPDNYKLTVNADVVGLAGSAFSHQTKLKEAWLADGVKLLGHGIFAQSGIKTIRLPADLTYISRTAFYDTPIREIEIPASVTEIRKGAFYSCDGFDWGGKVILNNNKCKIDYEAFTFKPIIVYQGVEYTYSAQKPTVEGNYWYINYYDSINGYFAIW